MLSNIVGTAKISEIISLILLPIHVVTAQVIYVRNTADVLSPSYVLRHILEECLPSEFKVNSVLHSLLLTKLSREHIRKR